MFRRSSISVLEMFQMCFKEVLGYFKEDWGVFQETFKGDLRELQGYQKEVQRLLEGSVKAVSIYLSRRRACFIFSIKVGVCWWVGSRPWWKVPLLSISFFYPSPWPDTLTILGPMIFLHKTFWTQKFSDLSLKKIGCKILRPLSPPSQLEFMYKVKILRNFWTRESKPKQKRRIK